MGRCAAHNCKANATTHEFGRAKNKIGVWGVVLVPLSLSLSLLSLNEKSAKSKHHVAAKERHRAERRRIHQR